MKIKPTVQAEVVCLRFVETATADVVVAAATDVKIVPEAAHFAIQKPYSFHEMKAHGSFVSAE